MLAEANSRIRRLKISRVKNTVTKDLVGRQFSSLRGEAEALALEVEKLADFRHRIGLLRSSQKAGRSVVGLKNSVYLAQESQYLTERCLRRERELRSLCLHTISRMETVLTVYSGLVCRDEKLIELIGKKQRELRRASCALESIDQEERVGR